VVYRDPFRHVEDDDGHALRRGVRTAVCEKTYRIYSGEPYRTHPDIVPPRVLVSLEEAPPFPCDAKDLRRHARETKGEDFRVATVASRNGCGPGGACC